MRFSQPLLLVLMTREQHAKAYAIYKRRKAWYLACKASTLSNSGPDSDEEVDLFLLGKKDKSVPPNVNDGKSCSSVLCNNDCSSAVPCNCTNPDLNETSNNNVDVDAEHGEGSATINDAKDKDGVLVQDDLDFGDADWKDRLDPLALERERLNEHIRKQKEGCTKYSQKYGPGRLVSSRYSEISTDDPKENDDNEKKPVRDKVFGVVLQGSPMDPDTWLVKFSNGLCFYAHIKLLIFENHNADSQMIDMILNKEEKDLCVKSVLMKWQKSMITSLKLFSILFLFVYPPPV